MTIYKPPKRIWRPWLDAAAMRTPRVILLLLLLIPGVLWARDAREETRIEHLIQTVESLKGAAFIRNGTEYGAKDAGKHLRLKLKLAGDRVKTAEDFIEGYASRSSFSGAAYKIRLPDGTLTETAPFFRAKLREFDEAHK
ncbi:MAG TPA: DUF5329 family protein [Candidatus Limnocylindrales bacterium]|nr:DUF5329 family protein [Candidatus Limnocylindrales bacterium]